MGTSIVKSFNFIVVLCVVICVCESKYAFLETCSRNDPNLDACILKKAAIVAPRILKGIPEARIPSLDPLYIDLVNLQISRDMTITAKDIYVYGLDTYKFLDVKTDLKKREATGHFYLDNIALKGEYFVEGKLAVLDLSGISGPIFVNIDKVDLNITIYWDFYEKKGKSYCKIKNVEFDHNIGKIHVDLKNLFGKNDRLSKDVNTMLNENWQSLAKEFGDVVKQVVSIVLERVNGITKNIPYDELFPDT